MGSVSDRYAHSFRKCRHQPKVTQSGSVPSRHGGFLQLREMSPEVTDKSHPWAFPADSPAHSLALPAVIKWVYNAFIPLGKHLFHPLVQGSRARAWAVLSQPHLGDSPAGTTHQRPTLCCPHSALALPGFFANLPSLSLGNSLTSSVSCTAYSEWFPESAVFVLRPLS